MNRKFKSIIAVLLVALMLVPLAVPAFAGDVFKTVKSQVPIIYIAGDGESIYDKDGNELSNYVDIFDVLLGKMNDDDGGKMKLSPPSQMFFCRFSLKVSERAITTNTTKNSTKKLPSFSARFF